MALQFLPMILFSSLLLQLLLFGTAAAAPQSEQAGYASNPSGRIPILYEAYYPEPRDWSPQEASLREIERLRELTRQLLKEEEQLGQLAAAAVASPDAPEVPENVLEPRSQILEYVFSGRPRNEEQDVQVASLTVSDAGRHKIRHHHGEADWLLRRLAAGSPR